MKKASTKEGRRVEWKCEEKKYEKKGIRGVRKRSSAEKERRISEEACGSQKLEEARRCAIYRAPWGICATDPLHRTRSLCRRVREDMTHYGVCADTRSQGILMSVGSGGRAVKKRRRAGNFGGFTAYFAAG